ncbi:efflux RND transporter periplasmic adaptor subunit [Acetatifactor aquisgranensis]|uniref:efflux RND transporter periplasmic adaptor subunit n=1 Tax=Acetatifactor aquisgranensis TaxID=2941233 RepID=UPI00203D91EE|nr:hypothetical protein [Acetatifactor aquisgranensis]
MSRIKALATAALIAAAASLGGCGNSEQEEPLYREDFIAPEQANYDTVQIETGDYIRTAAGSVRIYYPVTADLRWDESQARFREFLVRKGDEVKAGDALAVFDIEVSRADREELALTLARTIENLETGTAERLTAMEEADKKLEGLGGHELRIEQLRIEKARAEYEQFVYQTEQEITRLRECLEEMDEEIADNTLVAPFNGVIDTIAACSEGDLVTKDMVIISMYSTDSYYLVAEDSLGRLRYNMEVTVETGRGSNLKTYQGKVVAAPSILPGSAPQGMALIELYEDVPPKELSGTLKYQYNAEELRDVLLVDWSAVEAEKGKSYVYVLEDDMVQKRYVVPGLNNREKMWILDGLREGQTVIAD